MIAFIRTMFAACLMMLSIWNITMERRYNADIAVMEQKLARLEAELKRLSQR